MKNIVQVALGLFLLGITVALLFRGLRGFDPEFVQFLLAATIAGGGTLLLNGLGRIPRN